MRVSVCAAMDWRPVHGLFPAFALFELDRHQQENNSSKPETTGGEMTCFFFLLLSWPQAQVFFFFSLSTFTENESEVNLMYNLDN